MQGRKTQRRLCPVLRGVRIAASSAPPQQPDADDAAVAAALAKIEPRLRGIYEQRKLGENPGRIPLVFSGRWLPDSSAYIIREPVSGSEAPALVRYEAASGARSVLDSAAAEAATSAGVLSPDGQHRATQQGGNLLLHSPAGATEAIPLTTSEPDSAVTNGRAAWSPDSRRLAFVQADASAVQLRARLIPGDPSYPTVETTRFARVGGVIPSLKVGVVDLSQPNPRTNWLPIPAPEEGYYLGMVDWAGNSHEILVEKLSRFRDTREFLLVDVESGVVTCVFSESDPAWVVASIAKNEGLEWLEGGRAFLVLSEKDGWRHAYRLP
eukprot:COSAG05_NODE_1477_length_4781_cov_6.449381_5_plen_324_part_00